MNKKTLPLLLATGLALLGGCSHYEVRPTPTPIAKAAPLSPPAEVTDDKGLSLKTLSMSEAVPSVVSTLTSPPDPVPVATSQQAKATREVSGILLADTTWTADYDYVMVKNVGIPAGITLTIEAGAQVFVNRYRLQIEGTLKAIGVSENHIGFSSNEKLGDTAQYGPGIEFIGEEQVDSVIEFAEFKSAGISISGDSSPLIQNNHFLAGGIYSDEGSPVIKNSVFEQSSIILMHPNSPVQITGNSVLNVPIGITVRAPLRDALISGNTIQDTREGLRINTAGGEKIRITKNLFKGNCTSISMQPARALKQPVSLQISENNFIHSTYEHISTHEYITSDIIASENYWGTTDETEIKRLIYDYYHDLKLPKVIWHPFLTSAVAD